MREKIQLLSILFITGIAMIGLILVGHHIVMTGVMMGGITTCGIAILWIKSPKVIKRGIAKGDILIDIAATIGIFSAFGLTVTGVVGAGITCIFLSILLKCNRIYFKGR